MKLLYDIETEEIIKVSSFLLEAKSNSMFNFTVSIEGIYIDYIKEWVLNTQKKYRLRKASEYKRDFYYSDKNSNNIIKLIGCFITSVEYKDNSVEAIIYCDYSIIGSDETFPELKSLFRNSLIESLGI